MIVRLFNLILHSETKQMYAYNGSVSHMCNNIYILINSYSIIRPSYVCMNDVFSYEFYHYMKRNHFEIDFLWIKGNI